MNIGKMKDVMHLTQTIGRLMMEIQQSGQFAEITVNSTNEPGWELSGYNGYDASRDSYIENTEMGVELQNAFNDLTELLNEDTEV